jgi:hypothetical protein
MISPDYEAEVYLFAVGSAVVVQEVDLAGRARDVNLGNRPNFGAGEVADDAVDAIDIVVLAEASNSTFEFLTRY